MNAPRWRYVLSATVLLVGPLCTTGCQTETTSRPALQTWAPDTATTIPPSNGAQGHTLLPGGVPNGIRSQ
jgi:hypothetical protein